MQFDAARRHDTGSRLSRVSTPALVLHGTADAVIGVDNGRQLAASIPGARLELFEGAGHLFWWEEPRRTAVLLVAHAQ